MPDYTAVAPPSNYGAPAVFQQGQQSGQGQQGGAQQQSPVAALMAKAKQLLSSGQISPDQYTQLSTQYMGGNMGAAMPVAPQAGAPMNIVPTGT